MGAQVAQTAHVLAAAASLTRRPNDSGPLPRREGVAECSYFMKTGECKYGSSCKWDHPDRGPLSKVNRFGNTTGILNSRGYPLREGESVCTFYQMNGECKFGETCKYHHPEPVPPAPATSGDNGSCV